ncbi:NADH-quinone oxidoreductase subunit L [Phycisphaerales bacterium AB-hyl4]|uniref:NADH-quinone oxidoreductase subunit L n=1 Tax=Natronomicrosphaera hydrolytica TaxID=3242702 RepID=A0ABV4U156_9BACT
MDLDLIKFLPWIPLLGAVLCMICCIKPQWRKAAGAICVASIAIPFLMAISVYGQVRGLDVGETVTFFRWIHVGDFTADFAYYMDTLTMVMLFVVTGIGSLVALYATGYMAGDRGYARFFAAVALFIFAMTSMVMGSNLIMLYLGWEMVGLASYLLIGYYYHKPAAVEAAKKAFIVNRIGDLGFAMGILTVYMTFGSVHYADILPAAQALIGQVDVSSLTEGALAAYESASLPENTTWVMAAPLLLLLGALGKSAQIPFYVWLPDAMEGPSPVSALIHAATMVTSGVYMVARLMPLFEFSPYALPTVATIGGLTAIFAATIALCQYDIKKIFAYSTVSQLGYMFLGVGVLAPTAGMWHLISHAFFKGLLFLTAGSVMHAMAGQLDIRKMSGLRHKMPVTCWLMFAACLALAGFPLTTGFFSKDMIIAYTLDWGRAEEGASAWYFTLGILALVTAFITASYGFRAWFRVFWGPEKWEMGDDDHGAPEPQSPDHSHADADHGHEAHHDEHGADHAHGHHHEPHEMPWWPMNIPLVILAIGSLFGGLLGYVGAFGGHSYGWIGSMVYDSTARTHTSIPHGRPLLGMDPHIAMFFISGAIAIVAIALAWYLHVKNRDAVAKLADATRPIVTLLNNKYYVDEIYDVLIRRPLRLMGWVFYILDQFLINGIVYGLAWVPRLLGLGLRPSQNGRLQGYGLGMAAGVAIITALVLWAMV